MPLVQAQGDTVNDPVIENEKGETNMSAQVRSMVSSVWWLLLLQGIAALILGILMVTYPAATLVVIPVYIGVYLLISGILSFIRMFTAPAGWGWSLVNGIIGVLAGFFILKHPLYNAILVPTILVIILAIQVLIMGVIDLVRGFQGAGPGAFVLGVLNILIGLWLLFHPLPAAWALPVVLGVLGIVGGIVAIFFAFRVRGLVNQVTQEIT